MSSARSSRWPWAAALAYSIFPVYGSLIPFRWSPQPWASALARFLDVLGGPLTVVSRADFAANVLLALPLALLWLAALASPDRAGRVGRAVALAAAVWLGCSAFAMGLEFAQIFFSGRQPALSDVVAQSIGAALGVLAFGAVPGSFWQRSVSPDATWRRACVLYLVGLVVYALLPLDLTVTRSEIAAKWTAGKIQLVPFTRWRGDPLGGVVDFALDAVIWALAATLARRAVRVPWVVIGTGLVTLAALLEGAQLLVISRVVDTTDILAAAFGVTVVALWGRAGLATGAPTGPSERRWGVAWPLLTAAAILLVHTWPFDFVTDPLALRPRLLKLTWLPFASYATATELYLVTNVLRRLAIYAVFAWLVAAQLPSRWRSRTLRASLAALAAVGLAAVVEGLQVFLPGRVVDTGDLLLAAVAGGLAVSLWPRPSLALAPAPLSGEGRAARGVPGPLGRVASWRRSGQPKAAAAVPSAGLAAGVAMSVLFAAVVLAYLPGVPYNLRELLAPDGLPWPALVVSAGALLMLGAPAMVARLAVPGRGVPYGRTLAMLCGGPLALAALLVGGAPRESVHDIVGSPVLGGPGVLELTGRLSVLLLGVSWALSLGHALHGGSLRPGQRGGSVAHLLLHGLWIAPLWHAVVVTWAATDNLTELMADGGGALSTACLLAYVGLVGAASAALAAALAGGARRAWLSAVVAAIASLGLGWLLLGWGTQDLIFKYGRVFSALQFLLSAHRDAYVTGTALAARFVVAHLGLLAVAAAGLLVVGAWMEKGPRPAGRTRPRRAGPADTPSHPGKPGGHPPA